MRNRRSLRVAGLLAIALAALLIRPLRTPLDAEPQTLAAAAGLTCSVAVLGIWLLNPFMALLLVPAAHVWLLPARAQGPPRSTTIAIFALISLIPILLLKEPRRSGRPMARSRAKASLRAASDQPPCGIARLAIRSSVTLGLTAASAITPPRPEYRRSRCFRLPARVRDRRSSRCDRPP